MSNHFTRIKRGQKDGYGNNLVNMFHLLELSFGRKNNFVAGKLLILISLTTVMFIVSCENQVLSSFPTQDSDQRLLKTDRSLELNNMLTDNNNLEELKIKKCVFLSDIPDMASAGVVLEDATIKGAILHTTLSYNGGCEPHDFDLICTTVNDLTSLNISAWILHHSNNDRCEQWVTETRAFDLSPLKENYYQASDKPCNFLNISLFDTQGSQIAVPVTYEICLENPVVPPGSPLPPIVDPSSQLSYEISFDNPIIIPIPPLPPVHNNRNLTAD